MLSRRKFIAAAASLGILPFLPKPVRAWSRELFLPRGALLKGPGGELIAATKVDLFRFDVSCVDALEWLSEKPSPGDAISRDFTWALTNARARLGIILSGQDILNADHLIEMGFPDPTAV